MNIRNRLIRWPAIAGATLTIAALVAGAGVAVNAGAAVEPRDDRALAHVLDRVTFGMRPGDVERLRQLGVPAFIDRQLHPERIDDGALESRLQDLDTLTLSTREIAQEYFLPARQARRERKREQAAPPQDKTPEMMKQRQVMLELDEQKLLRATYSERQLQEVLVDFWFNHFNVFAGKGPERIMLTSYERDVIRPNVFGRFRDLLGATAHSPAMLFFLDNWMSVDPKAAQQAGTQRRTGLNENYGRELMELHTLGVDGGYTQQDIIEVARALTGWTIAEPRRGAWFRFDARLHDSEEKVVLGHKIAAGGEKEGEQVLDILARHPSTARFIATKLARRFVSDDPPQSLVDRAARRFQDTDGDLREVVRTILTSPEFSDPPAYRAKVKSPLEFVVSALRATGAEVRRTAALARSLQQLGMPLYLCQPPTGYGDRAETWVNTGALVGRVNFAVSLANDQIPGVRANLSSLAGRGGDDIATARHELSRGWLRNDVSSATMATLAKASDIPQLAALTIGAPEFQRK